MTTAAHVEVEVAGTAEVEERPLRPTLQVVLESWQLGRVKVGVVTTLAVVLVAMVGPALAPHHPGDLVGVPFGPPRTGVPLGTDYLGHDVLSRVLWGGRSVLWMAFAATTIGVGIGVMLGLVAGYSRKVVDDVIMRSLDVVYAFPGLVLVLLFVSMLGPKLWLIVFLVAVAWIPQVARVARGITGEVVTREFVEAAEVIGVPRRRILLRDVLPNLMTPLLVEYGMRLTWSVGAIAAISFLGFGVQPPNTDWGLMINENRSGLTVTPWGVVVPAACIAVFAIGTNLIADGMARSIAGIDRKVKVQ